MLLMVDKLDPKWALRRASGLVAESVIEMEQWLGRKKENASDHWLESWSE